MIKVKILGRNVVEIQTKEGTFLQSYNEIVAAFIKGKSYKTSTKWSMTTTKHINAWVVGDVEEKPQEFFDSLV